MKYNFLSRILTSFNFYSQNSFLEKRRLFEEAKSNEFLWDDGSTSSLKAEDPEIDVTEGKIRALELQQKEEERAGTMKESFDARSSLALSMIQNITGLFSTNTSPEKVLLNMDEKGIQTMFSVFGESEKAKMYLTSLGIPSDTIDKKFTTPHFTPEETEVDLGTIIQYTKPGNAQEGLNRMNPPALKLMEEVIAYCGEQNIDFLFTSTCRTPEGNRKANGAPKSDHLTGNAFDVVPNGRNFAQMQQIGGHFKQKYPTLWVDIHNKGTGSHLHLSVRGDIFNDHVNPSNSMLATRQQQSRTDSHI